MSLKQGYFLFYLLYAYAWYLRLCLKIIIIIKKKKNQKAFAWLQACFLGDVRIIRCNFLGDSYFQTNVIDNVENLFDNYLHITFFLCFVHILVAHTTHKSMLNYVHEIVCCLVWSSLIAYNFLCKCKFLFWSGICRKMCLEV